MELGVLFFKGLNGVPLGLRLDSDSGLGASIVPPLIFYRHEGLDRHVAIYHNLAGEAHVAELVDVPQLVVLGFSHHGRLSLFELHAAGGAVGLSPAAVPYVNPRVLNGPDEPRALFNLKRAGSFNREFVHV